MTVFFWPRLRAVGGAAKSAAFSLLDIGSIISHLRSTLRIQWLTSHWSKFWQLLTVLHPTSCCLSLPLSSLFLHLWGFDQHLAPFYGGSLVLILGYQNTYTITHLWLNALCFHNWRSALLDLMQTHSACTPHRLRRFPHQHHLCISFFTPALSPPSLHIAPTSSSPRCPPLALSAKAPLSAIALCALVSGQ